MDSPFEKDRKNYRYFVRVWPYLLWFELLSVLVLFPRKAHEIVCFIANWDMPCVYTMRYLCIFVNGRQGCRGPTPNMQTVPDYIIGKNLNYDLTTLHSWLVKFTSILLYFCLQNSVLVLLLKALLGKEKFLLLQNGIMHRAVRVCHRHDAFSR